MLKTYHGNQCIKINPFAINEIGLINLFVEKISDLKKIPNNFSSTVDLCILAKKNT